MKIGYVKLGYQSDDRQLAVDHQLPNLVLDKIYTDDYHHDVERDHPYLDLLLNDLQKDDIVYVQSIDKLSINIEEVNELVNLIIARECSICFVRDNFFIDHHDKEGAKAKLNLLSSLLQALIVFDKERLALRQRAGIEKARKMGLYKGRKGQSSDNIKKIKFYHENGLSVSDIARRMNLTRSTIYKYL